MLKIKIISTLIAISSLFSLKAVSQTQIVTIASILENPSDGEEVTLTGRIINQTEGEDYIFTDGVNEITIELQDSSFLYNPNETVKISGIINFESEHLEEKVEDTTPENIEIDVEKIEVIDTSTN